MSKVKMNAKLEYEFLANYKVLQNYFKLKKIDKVRCVLLWKFPSFLTSISLFQYRSSSCVKCSMFSLVQPFYSAA